jgi:hypothetical protein
MMPNYENIATTLSVIVPLAAISLGVALVIR